MIQGPIATLPTFTHIRQHTREQCSIASAPDWLVFQHHDLIIAFSQSKKCENPFIHSQAMAEIVTTVDKDLGIGPVSLRYPPSICYRGHLSENRETRYQALHRSVRISSVHPHCIAFSTVAPSFDCITSSLFDQIQLLQIWPTKPPT